MFWNVNLILITTSSSSCSGLGQGLRKRWSKLLGNTLQCLLVIYLECLWHTLLCIRVQVYIQAPCILLSAVSQAPDLQAYQVFVLYIVVCLIFGKQAENICTCWLMSRTRFIRLHVRYVSVFTCGRLSPSLHFLVSVPDLLGFLLCGLFPLEATRTARIKVVILIQLPGTGKELLSKTQH